MVLWKDKLIIFFTKLLRKKWDQSQQNHKWKRKCYNWQDWNTKVYKRLLWPIIHQQNGQIRRHRKIIRNIQLYQDWLERKGKSEQTNNFEETESVKQTNKNLPSETSQGPDTLTGEILKHLNKNKDRCKLFLKSNKDKGICTNLFNEASITLILKPEEGTTRKV